MADGEMKVLELLEELVDIVDTAPNVRFNNEKIIVNSQEILEIVEQIKLELPNDMQQAKWMVDNEKRLTDEAKKVYEDVLSDARKQAQVLVENDIITRNAEEKAADIKAECEAEIKAMKVGLYEHMSKVLEEFQSKIERMKSERIDAMFDDFQASLNDIYRDIETNDDWVRDMKYKVETDEA